jgi:dTDP-glucose pyrophosphorylase
MKVLITTSGVGSRLGDYTKYTNKSLMRIGVKPAISHIIDNYPIYTKFVITLGYFSEHVKQYLEIAYPNHSFEFIEVSKYQGPGSSLMYSLLQAESSLQEPFIYHASDTLVFDEIKDPQFNWIGGYQGQATSSYASFDVQGSYATSIYSKGNLKPDYLYIGLSGIFDYKEYWKLANEIIISKNFSSELGDVEILQELIKNKKIHFLNIRQWFDIGNVDRLNEARVKAKDNSIHVLDKLDENIFKINKTIIKFFHNPTICENRIKRMSYIGHTLPTLLAYTKNFYKYEYVEGQLFSNLRDKKYINLLLDWGVENLWTSSLIESKRSLYEICYEFYYKKTIERLNKFTKTFGIIDKSDIINNILVPSVKDLINKIDLNEVCLTKATNFHGDFILDNILLTGIENFCLIDWRQDFGGELQAGDMYYDLAKFSHSLVVNHELVERHLYETVNNFDGTINVNIHRLQSSVEFEYEYFRWIAKNGYNKRKILILRSLIWINMAALHERSFAIFLYYFGRYNLYNVLNYNEI